MAQTPEVWSEEEEDEEEEEVIRIVARTSVIIPVPARPIIGPHIPRVPGYRSPEQWLKLCFIYWRTFVRTPPRLRPRFRLRNAPLQ